MKGGKLRIGVACTLLSLLSFQGRAQDQEFRFEGIATPLSGSQTIYREQHRVTGQCSDGYWHPTQQDVRYVRSGTGEAFATKTLVYSTSLFRPGLEFRQPAFDEVLRIDAGAENLDIRWSRGDEEEGSWALDVSDTLVLDAGFDHFIRQHWEQLTVGESVPFQFVAPTRGESYGFVAEPAGDPIDGADHSFRIRPTGLIMRMAVDPIRLGYRKDGFLTHYSGLGNIRRNQDENYRVSIRYTQDNPPPCPLLPRLKGP